MTGVQTCALPICFPVTIGKVNEIEDISLVELGDFNTETGEMFGAKPNQLCKLVDLKETYNAKS